MMKYFLPIALLLLSFGWMHAQRPTGVRIEGSFGKPGTARAKADCNNAGTVLFAGHRGQSNDVTPDTIFLCFGDSLDILHNRDFVLTGDPVPATPAGVGYGFYNCRPSISGPTLSAIAADSCLVKTPPPPSGPFYIAPGFNLQGDITFINDGFLQTNFNNGNPKLWWFAPITYDRLTAGGAQYEGTPAGPCVNVNVNAAFAVVYLNAIRASNINTSASSTGCRGSFIVRGGLPEWDPLTRYTVDISLVGDASVKGRLENTPLHNDTVKFFVPRPGIYNITIEDGKSCGTSFTMDMSGCRTVSLTLPARSALPGDNVCVQVRVGNFRSIGTTQFTIKWDPAVLRFASVGGFNPALTGLEPGSFNTNQNNGTLTFAWFNTSLAGSTLPDSASMFEICFNVTGPLGSRSLLQFINEPTPILVGDTTLTELGYVIRNGIVAVTNNQLIALLEQDSVSCPRSADGAFRMAVFGGTPPYTFRWRPLDPAGPFNGPFTLNAEGENFTARNLNAGRYEVIIRDSSTPANNLTDTVRVLRNSLIGVSLTGIEPACAGESTGSVRAVVNLEGVVQSDPINRFTFTWNVPTNNNTAELNGIPFGPYAVTVTDARGCSESASLSLTQPAPINLVEAVTNASCSGSADGTISVTVNGGAPRAGNYTFRWSHLPDSTVAPTNVLNNLDPGNYTLTVTDGNRCEVVESYTIGALKTLSIQRLTVRNVTCNGSNNGVISIRGATTPANLESLPYTFNWQGSGTINPNNTNNTSSLTNLVAGIYLLTMIDSDPRGCQVVDTFRITEPEPLALTVIDRQNETCTVGRDGRATIGVSGGTFPYNYNWSNGQTDSVATNLASGVYTLRVVDANNCADSLSVTITAPTPPTILPITPDTVSCQNSTDGSLTANATPVPGTTITRYEWSNGRQGQTISNLSPGIYIVTVTASDGCTNSDTARVISPDPIAIDSIVSTSPTCVGFDNGRATVFARGGTRPYRYIWANTPRNDTLTANVYGQLTAGTYNVTVVDANNCAPATGSITITDPPGIDITFSAVSGVSCFENTCDGRATAAAIYTNGATGLFTFSWQSGEVQTGVASSSAIQLCPGAQVVVATDANNCFSIDTVNIPSPPAILVQVNAEPVSCNGRQDGAITLTPSGGTPPFRFQWQHDNSAAAQISNLRAGLYNAVITDANGCTKTQIVELNEPDRLQLTLDPSTTPLVTCSGDKNGRIAVRFNSGANINPVGSAPFTWSNNVAPPSSPVATNLAPGTYSVTITDVKGCTDTLSFTITNPPPVVAVIRPPASPRCFGESTVIVIDTVFGGTGTTLFDYTYQINNSGLRFPPNQPATVFAGRQIITVEDPGGCAFRDTIEITQPDEIQVIFDPAKVVIELGDSTTLTPIINASLPIATYTWTPNTFLSSANVETPQVSPLRDETYTLTVVDVNGCKGVGTVRIDVDFNRNVFIPNVFSPNGDGPNDDFRIFTCNGVRAIRQVSIFDRWGNLMFSANELTPVCAGVKLWDGRLNNRLANPGVYVYMIEIEFIDDVKLVYRGDVTLLR